MNKQAIVEFLSNDPCFYTHSTLDTDIGEFKPENELYGMFINTDHDIELLLTSIKNRSMSTILKQNNFGKLVEVNKFSCYGAFYRDNGIWYDYFYRTDQYGNFFNPGKATTLSSKDTAADRAHSKARTIDSVANDNTGGKSMSKASETMQMVVSMKMLKGLLSDGKGKEADLGKLIIMQQMMSGEKLQVSDVLKAKLINEFSLDESKDLPIEKVMLLQMLDGGEIDMTQLISMKMFGELFKDDEEKKGE